MQVKDIVQFLEESFPLSLQESYDNAGLICGRMDQEVEGVLLCLDSLEATVDEAIAKNCQLIIAHHPIIFKGLKKITPQGSFEITTRLKYIITSVNGKRELATIRDFVDNGLTAKDARALREYYAQIQPDIDMTYYPEGAEEGISIPVGINFFWPDSGR